MKFKAPKSLEGKQVFVGRRYVGRVKGGVLSIVGGYTDHIGAELKKRKFESLDKETPPSAKRRKRKLDG